MTDGTLVALYARVSSDPQEHSLDSQLRELREHAAREGLEIVEEVRDLAEKRHVLERPGVDRLRDLAESGAIEAVWAWELARYGQEPVPTLLAIELEEHGVRLRALDDGGEGLGGEIIRAVGGVLSREEQRKRVRRSSRGKRAKAWEGQVLGAAPGPRYGFRYVRDAKGKVLGYEVDPEQMAVVLHVFRLLDGGESIHAVQVALEEAGVKAPRGGVRWSRDTIRNMVREDIYLPHTGEELAALVAEGLMSGEVHSHLDPGRPYGVAYYGRTRSEYVSIRSKKRRVKPTPRKEWTAIPVSLEGSGLERGRVERARQTIEGNRAPAKVGDRVWQLSRGFLFCAHCGRSMIAHARRFKSATKRDHFYYRCDQRRKTRGTAEPCPNRKSHQAIELEWDAVEMFERYADMEVLLQLYDEAVEEEEKRLGLHGNLGRRAALEERLAELELERKGYLRQNARGVLADGELDAMLSEIDAQREDITTDLRAAEEAASSTSRIQALRSCLLSAEWCEAPEVVQPGEYLSSTASQEEIRRAYRRYGARFEIDEYGGLTLRFALRLDGAGLHLTSSRS